MKNERQNLEMALGYTIDYLIKSRGITFGETLDLTIKDVLTELAKMSEQKGGAKI